MDDLLILLDMDGVVMNFFAATCKAFGVDPAEGERKLEPLDWWFKSVIGDVGPAKFWEVIDARGASFWADMDPYPHARQLYEGLCQIAPVQFLSWPSEKPHCAAGKLESLCKHFPDAMENQDYHLTKHKHRLAQRGHLLIDDHEDYVRTFRKKSDAILFPRRWNSRHPAERDAVHETLRLAAEWRHRLVRAA